MTKPLFEKRLWMPCRDTVATGLALGLFFGMLPMIPQSIFAGVVAMWMRANVPSAVAATWLSNPFTNVPIWAAQLWLGNWLQDHLNLPIPEMLSMAKPIPGLGVVNPANFILGAAFSGLILGALAFPVTHLFSVLMPHHLPRRRAQVAKVKATPVSQSSGN